MMRKTSKTAQPRLPSAAPLIREGDALILKADRKEPLSSMRLEDVLELARWDLTSWNLTETGG